MSEIRYIHAADLHLDTPFTGLTRAFGENEPWRKMLENSTFLALERLVDLCELEKPDFLVLAGDIYNQQASLSAQLKLHSACQRLQRHGIDVFIAHGNHDPYASCVATLDWPENTIFFGTDVEQYTYKKDGEIAAIIHGISHGSDHEARNLAQLFHRDSNSECFQLGVLHCLVEGDSHGDRYAPCSLEDLINAGLDAWALGHVHQKRILCEKPFIAYSGNTQGLHVNETGQRGCQLVTASRSGGEWHCHAEFKNLAPILWDIMEINIGGADNFTAIETVLRQELEEYRAIASPAWNAIILRIILGGRSNADAQLRNSENLRYLAEKIFSTSEGHPPIWIKDFEVRTTPAIQDADYLAREDLLGEITRLAMELENNASELDSLAARVLAPLFGNVRFGKNIAFPDGAELLSILEDAKRLCQEKLEAR